MATRPIDVLPQLARAVAGGRARADAPPSSERLRELERKLAAGEYEIPVEKVAEAFLRAQGRSVRPG